MYYVDNDPSIETEQTLFNLGLKINCLSNKCNCWIVNIISCMDEYRVLFNFI